MKHDVVDHFEIEDMYVFYTMENKVLFVKGTQFMDNAVGIEHIIKNIHWYNHVKKDLHPQLRQVIDHEINVILAKEFSKKHINYKKYVYFYPDNIVVLLDTINKINPITTHEKLHHCLSSIMQGYSYKTIASTMPV